MYNVNESESDVEYTYIDAGEWQLRNSRQELPAIYIHRCVHVHLCVYGYKWYLLQFAYDSINTHIHIHIEVHSSRYIYIYVSPAGEPKTGFEFKQKTP